MHLKPSSKLSSKPITSKLCLVYYRVHNFKSKQLMSLIVSLLEGFE